MEYSKLATDFSQNNKSEINELLRELRPRLIRFLHIHLNASPEDAEDCAQEAILASLETMKDGKMRDSEYLLSFLLTSCRNNYLNLQNKKRARLDNKKLDETARPPQQLAELLDEEKQQFLLQCLKKLSDDYRTFITYWFKNPGSEAKNAAKHFRMSASNVWTKKHRVIKKLNICYQKKIKK